MLADLVDVHASSMVEDEGESQGCGPGLVVRRSEQMPPEIVVSLSDNYRGQNGSCKDAPRCEREIPQTGEGEAHGAAPSSFFGTIV